MAELTTPLYVLLMVAMIDVDLLGLLYFWGLTSNFVTIANIIISVGIAVDYNAHIAHAFKQATGTRNERVVKTFDTIGVSVLHGATSTFIAILPMSTSETYIF